jgi:hypothetical protein
MKAPSYRDYLANAPAVLEQVERAARRERAEAMDCFVFTPLMRFLRRAMPKPVQPPQTLTA